MPGAFNAGIADRLPSRTTRPSMPPRTASAKHYLLPGPPSPAAFLAARAHSCPASRAPAQRPPRRTRMSPP